jgi:hypothetical protein
VSSQTGSAVPAATSNAAVGTTTRTILIRIYKAVQSLLSRIGITFAATRHSMMVAKPTSRNNPEMVNLALWRPFAIDDRWRELYKYAQTVSHSEASDNLLKQCRFYSTFQMADYAAGLPAGDVIECGCLHGHSTVAISTLLKEHGFDGEFHVFDSFEGGLSDFLPEDDSFFGLSEVEKRTLVDTFKSSAEFVKSITEQFGFVELHKGWIPDSFAGFERRPLRFVHIDVDMYEPTKAALDFFWDSVVPGGCVIVDDYNYSIFEGANRAVDEFLVGKSPQLVYKVPFGSIVLIK